MLILTAINKMQVAAVNNLGYFGWNVRYIPLQYFYEMIIIIVNSNYVTGERIKGSKFHGPLRPEGNS